MPGHRYVVRARITLNEVLRFTTDTAYPVLGPDGNKHVKLEMVGDGAATARCRAPDRVQRRRLRFGAAGGAAFGNHASSRS